jgi:hypothetical protein
MNRVADISKLAADAWSVRVRSRHAQRVHPSSSILDRDGVINRDSEQFIKSPDEWRRCPGAWKRSRD